MKEFLFITFIVTIVGLLTIVVLDMPWWASGIFIGGTSGALTAGAVRKRKEAQNESR